MADEIGEALQRVASASENSNISLEKSASWLATISSISRESASTIGRSLNSVISRYESIKKTGFNSEDATQLNDVVEALSKIGITATDSQGQLKDFAEVMDLLGSKFNTLSKNEQAYITTTLFGTYQRNRGITLLKNYNDSLKNYETALNSAGVAQQKFDIYQDSTASKIDKLRATVEGFYQKSLNSSMIKGFIDGLTSIVSAFDNLGKVATIAGTALLMWKGADILKFFKELPTSISKSAKEMQFFKTMSTAMQLQEQGLLTTTQLLSVSFKALGTSIKTAFLSNPLGWLALGVTAIVSAVDMFNNKSEEAKRKADEFKQTVQEQKDWLTSIDSLTAQYKQNAKSALTDESAKSQLLDVQNQLKEAFEKTGQSIQFETDNIEKNIEKIKELKREKLEDYINTNFAKINEIQVAMAKKSDGLGVFNSSLSGTNLSFGKVSDNVSKTLGIDLDSAEYSKEEFVKIIDQILQKQRELNLANSSDYLGDQFVGQLADKYKELKDEVDANNSSIQIFNEYQKTFVQESINGLDKLDEKQKKLYSDLSNSVKFDPKNTNQYQKSLQDLVNIITEFGNKPSELQGKLQTWASNNNATTDSIDKLTDSTKIAIGTVESYKNQIEKQNKEIDDTQSSLKSLADMYYQVSEGQSLNSDQMLDLIQQYPEIIKYMDSEGNLMISQQDLLKTLFELKKQDRIQTLKAEKDKTDAVINGLSAQRDAYLGFYKAMGTTLNLTEDQATGMFGFDKKAYDVAVKASSEAQAKINALEKLTFKTYEPKEKTKKTSNNSSPASQSDALIEKDRYYQLNQELNKTNALLQKNAALQENTSYKEKIELLDKEEKLLQKKQTQIHAIAEEERKERAELVKKLSGKEYGVGFTGSGDDISATNAQSVLDKALINVNAHRNDKDKTAYNNLKTSYDTLKKSLDRFFEIQLTDLPKATEEWNKLKKQINEINTDKLSESFKEFEKSLSPTIDKLSETDSKLKLVAKNDVNSKIKLIKDQINLTNKIIAAYSKELNKLEEQYNKGGQSSEFLKDKISELKNKLHESKITIEEYTDSISDLTQQQNEAKLDALESVQDKIVEILRKRYEEEEKLAETAHQNNLDRLDEDLDKYREYINAQLDLLDKKSEAEEYNKRLQEETSKLADIDTEIAKYSMADDMESRNKVRELQKQKTDQQSTINDLSSDHTRQLEKERLQDSLTAYEKYIKTQQDLENSNYETLKAIYEKRNTDEALFAEAQKILTTQTFDQLKATYIDFENRFGQGMGILGDKIKNDFISKLQMAKDAVVDLDNIIAGATSGNSTQPTTPTNPSPSSTSANSPSYPSNDHRNLGGGFEKMTSSDFVLYKYYKKLESEGRDNQRSSTALMALLRKYGISGDGYSYDAIKGYFDNGGVAYGVGFMAKNTIKPERTLSPEQTSAFDRLVDYLPKMDSLLQNILPKVNIPNFNNLKLAGNNGVGNIEVNMSIANVNSEVDLMKAAEKVGQIVISKINRNFQK